MWPISSWEENKQCCYKLSKCTKWHLFHSKWSKLSFWVKIVDIFSAAQLETTFIFFSAWDRSHVKWDNSQNSTQKMRTWVIYARFAKNMADSSQPILSLNNSTSNCWSSSGRVGSHYISVIFHSECIGLNGSVCLIRIKTCLICNLKGLK